MSSPTGSEGRFVLRAPGVPDAIVHVRFGAPVECDGWWECWFAFEVGSTRHRDVLFGSDSLDALIKCMAFVATTVGQLAEERGATLEPAERWAPLAALGRARP